MVKEARLQLPECFGNYARFMVDDEFSAEDCIRCRFESQCYKVTTADAMSSIATNLNLLIDNLVDQGKIQEYDELCPDDHDALLGDLELEEADEEEEEV